MYMCTCAFKHSFLHEPVLNSNSNSNSGYIPYPAGRLRVDGAHCNGGPGHPVLVHLGEGGGDSPEEELADGDVGLPAEEGKEGGEDLLGGGIGGQGPFTSICVH